MPTRPPTWGSRLLVALALSCAACRPPAKGSDLDPALWDPDWFVVGVSTGDEFFGRKRPRAGEVGRVYVLIIDQRCRPIPGVVRYQPWRKPQYASELDPELVRELEERHRGKFEPESELASPKWRIPASGGAFELPPGTWQLLVTPRPEGRPWPEHGHARIFAEVTVTAEDDFVFSFHHAVPPRTRHRDAYERRLRRRRDRYSGRCFAGPHLTPRFHVELDAAARCDVEAPNQAASSCVPGSD